MIIDAFTFFNELDLLELRLNYLNDYVDYFVLVESNVSHSGENKPLIFLENKERFSKFKDKIIYHPYIFYNNNNIDFTNKPSGFDYDSSHWMLEKNQRNHILNCIQQFSDDDFIMISDLDEIPSTAAIKFASENFLAGVEKAAFQQQLYYYNPYTLDPTPWMGTVFTNIKSVKALTPQWFRDHRNDKNLIPQIYNAGWHFSYFGGIDKIITKINNTAHQELNRDSFKSKENIINAIDKGVNLYHNSVAYKKVELDLLPSSIIDLLGAFIKKDPITIVVPTMWKYPRFPEFLEKLVDHELVGEVIIVDNDRANRPISAVFDHKKIRLFDFNKNIFVNPAWNLGVEQSNYENICLMNDDIEFDLKLLSRVSNFLNPEKLLGLCPGLAEFHQPPVTDGSISFEKYRNQNFFGFGCLMFFQKKNYIPIPQGLNIYYGDNWLLETMLSRFDQTYLITNLKFTTPYATTTKTVTDKDAILGTENSIYKKEIISFKNKKNTNYSQLLEAEYQTACATYSDIYQHLPLLRSLADECDTMIEMGVRTGVSSRAFLTSKVKKINSYDLDVNDTVGNLFELARNAGKDATYTQADVLKLEIDPVDLLFIDTWHTYDQLSKELALHGNKATKYLVFHDTHTFGLGPPETDRGLLPAILEFMQKNPHWKVHYHTVMNNGLTVLKRESTSTLSKNAVIGTAIGYNKDTLYKFVKSFRAVNSVDDIILIFNADISADLKDFLNTCNVKTINFYSSKYLDMLPHNFRYLKILEILQESTYDSAFLTDVRDVVFQQNPFSNIENKLYLFLEDSGVRLQDEFINADWIKMLYGTETFIKMADRSIICSGTILGSRLELVKLLKLMVDKLPSTDFKNRMPVDQAMVNYLFYQNLLSDSNCTLMKNGDIVGTVGLTVTHAMAKDVIDIKDNLVYINGNLPCVIHQYDRSTQLINFFNKL